MIEFLKTSFQRLMGGGMGAVLYRGAAIQMLIQIVGMGLALGLHFVLARALGAESYGHYAFSVAWLSLLTALAMTGLDTTSLRWVAAYRAQDDWPRLRGFLRGSRMVLLSTSALTAGALLLAVWVLRDRASPELMRTLPWLGLAVPLAAFITVWASRLRGLKEVVRGPLPLSIAHPIVFGLVFIALLRSGASPADAPMAISAHVCGLFAALSVALYFFRRHAPRELRTATPRYEVRTWVRTALPLFGFSMLVLLRDRATPIFVGWFEPAEQVGFYAASARFGQLTILGLMAIASWAAPFISEMHAKGERERLQRLVVLVARGGSAFMLPISLVFIVFGKTLLGLFGDEFVAGYAVLVILSVGQCVNGLTGAVGFLMTMTGQHTAAMWIEAVSAVLHLALVTSLIPLYGIEGAALGTALSNVFRNVAMFVVVRRRLGIRSTIF